jgi:peptidoglycan/LPS O-acetylase OafA/YrhL
MLVLAVLAPYFFTSGTAKYLSIPGFSFIRETFTINAKQIYGALIFVNGFKTQTPAINGPLWSLSIEAWYYVIAAAIFLWPSKKIASSLLLLATAVVTYKNPLFFILLPIWFSGFGLAFFHQRRPQMNNRMFGVLFFLLSAGTIISIWLVLTKEPISASSLDDPMNHFRVISGLWFTCFLALLLGNSLIFPTLFHRTAAFSYTLYIIHFPIILFVVGMTQTIFIESLLNAAMVSIATASIAIAASVWLSKVVENKNLIEAFIVSHLKKTRSLRKAP